MVQPLTKLQGSCLYEKEPGYEAREQQLLQGKVQSNHYW